MARDRKAEAAAPIHAADIPQTSLPENPERKRAIEEAAREAAQSENLAGPPETPPEWAGAPLYGALVRTLLPELPDLLSHSELPELSTASVTAASSLVRSRPVVCPPDQLSAIDDEVFPDLASAVRYASESRLPFESILLDFTPASGRQAATIEWQGPPGHGAAPPAQLRGMIVSSSENDRLTYFCPIISVDGGPPELVGLVDVEWDQLDPPPSPQRIARRVAHFEPRFYTGSAIQELLGDQGPPAGGFFLAATPEDPTDQDAEDRAFFLAGAVAVFFTEALKVLYLLDSTNIELAEVDLPRQSRRRAARKGTPIASEIRISRGKSRSTDNAAHQPDDARLSHQFEVRGNFAHYGPDTYLYQHSDPEHLKPCPRCGRCRRVWRPPHIRGPEDKPLVVKVRKIPPLPSDASPR